MFSSCAKLNYQKLLESTVFCRILIYVERKCHIGNAGSCQAVGPRRFSSLLASGSCFLNRTPRNRKKPLSACSIVASGCIAAILADVDGGGHDDIPLQIVMIDGPWLWFIAIRNHKTWMLVSVCCSSAFSTSLQDFWWLRSEKKSPLKSSTSSTTSGASNIIINNIIIINIWNININPYHNHHLSLKIWLLVLTPSRVSWIPQQISQYPRYHQ